MSVIIKSSISPVLRTAPSTPPDAYKDATEDPIVKKELEFMTENSALSMIITLTIYYITVFLSPFINIPWVISHLKLHKHLNEDGTFKSAASRRVLTTPEAVIYRKKRAQKLAVRTFSSLLQLSQTVSSAPQA